MKMTHEMLKDTGTDDSSPDDNKSHLNEVVVASEDCNEYYTVDDAISYIGVGKFQWKLIVR